MIRRAWSWRRPTSITSRRPSGGQAPVADALRAEPPRPARACATRDARSAAATITGHGVTRTPWTIGTRHGHAPIACASEMPASSPAVVQVEPTASTIRAGGGSAPAAICSAKLERGGERAERADRRRAAGRHHEIAAAARAGSRTAPRSPSASGSAGSRSSRARRSSRSPTPMPAAGTRSPPRRCRRAARAAPVAIAWFEPYAPIAQIRRAPAIARMAEPDLEGPDLVAAVVRVRVTLALEPQRAAVDRDRRDRRRPVSERYAGNA